MDDIGRAAIAAREIRPRWILPSLRRWVPMAEAAPGHAKLVKKLFFGPLTDELVAPFTDGLEHIQASLNLNSSLPPVPL